MLSFLFIYFSLFIDRNQYLLEFCTTRFNLDNILVRFLFIKNLNKNTQSLVFFIFIEPLEL
jgi:hypothetical protein